MGENDEDFDRIKVFFSKDDKLKILGELLSCKSSRDIIKLLIAEECYTNEIVKKLDLRSGLVIHHLKKMELIGLLEVTNKKIIRKGQEHRFFRIPSGMIIFPEKSKKDDNLLKKFFKEGTKFVAIGISAILSYSLLDSKVFVPQIDAPIEPQVGQTDPLVYSLIVIIIGLAVLYFRKKRLVEFPDQTRNLTKCICLF